MADRKTLKLVEGLQADLDRELKATLQYIYHSSMVLGLRALTLGPHLRRQAEDELRHAAFLSDQIVNLGGVPKLAPPKIGETKELKQMLELDLDLERETILEFRERAKQAEAAGEFGLKLRLETLLAEETEQMRSLEKMLRGWQP